MKDSYMLFRLQRSFINKYLTMVNLAQNQQSAHLKMLQPHNYSRCSMYMYLKPCNYIKEQGVCKKYVTLVSDLR